MMSIVFGESWNIAIISEIYITTVELCILIVQICDLILSDLIWLFFPS